MTADPCRTTAPVRQASNHRGPTPTWPTTAVDVLPGSGPYGQPRWVQGPSSRFGGELTAGRPAPSIEKEQRPLIAAAAVQDPLLDGSKASLTAARSARIDVHGPTLECMIKAVVFDVGETLVDDTRFWRSWADWLGIPSHTMSALVGAVTVLGRDNADAIHLARPGVDLHAEYEAREAAGLGEHLEESDLYPDVRPTLAALRDHGVWIGVAGNQTVRAGELLRALGLPADAIATSGEWGIAKPSPAFYSRLIEWVGLLPKEILYVGDHPQNDVIAAKKAGLQAALIRRGPWGHFWFDETAVSEAADLKIESLMDLLGLLAEQCGTT
jgi:HAD superfamily hydrolase (TIGR01549 family)